MSIKKIMVIVLFLAATAMYAQHRPDKEKIKSLKVAFITERLELTSKEAEACWPIYNEQEEKIEAFHNQQRTQIYGKLKDVETLSDKEVDNLLEQHIALKEQRHKADKQFIKKLRTVISAKKTFLLLQTENGFKRRLLKQYRQKHRKDK